MNNVSFGQLSKKLLVSGIEKQVEGSEQVFITSFTSLSVNAIFELRKNLRESGSRYKVVKNTLLKRVAKDTSMAGIDEAVQGQCGLGLTEGDVSANSKVFTKFSEDNETFQVQGLYYEGKFYDAAAVKKLASLPSRQELLAKLLGSMNSPISGFVGVLSGTVRNFVSVVDQIKKQKEEA